MSGTVRKWFCIGLLAMTVLILGAPVFRSTAATPIQPQKIAIIVMENKNYDANEHTVGPDQFVVNSSGHTSHATYINGTIIPESLSITPDTLTCNYPVGDTQGNGTEACTGGMFQAGRDNINTNERVAGSAVEYAWMTQGTDANVGDGTDGVCFCPDRIRPPGVFATRNSGVIGYTRDTSVPSTTCAPAADGHCTANQNLWDVLENNDKAFAVYAEDYAGGTSTCDTSAGGSPPSLYYAKRHNPYLMAWDQTPDANTTKSPPTPSTAPDGSQCKAHLKDFPNNTPDSSTEPVQNFAGTESFGAVTYIVPSLCHSGHDSDSTCSGVSTDRRGGLYGSDRWLSLNYEAIRKDVGQNGVVILTWDEDADASNAGLSPPIPTFITPGETSNGRSDALAAAGCNPMPIGGCTDSSTIYDDSSTLKAILAAEGGSCSDLDNTQVYRGSSTAQGYCASAAALPITMEPSTAG